MSVTFKLVEANTDIEIDLVYDSVTQAQYQTYISGRSLDGPMSAKFHTPDDAPPELIQLVPGIRTMFFRLNIEGDDTTNKADDTLNKTIDLARWVDGENQQAARYWTDGDVNRIELHIAIDSATNITKIPIVYGNLSAIDAMLGVFGEDNQMAHGASVQLFTAPYGEGDSFTLRNDLLGSPGMTESSSNLALGLSLIGAPTTSMLTSRYLVSGQCQRINVDNSNGQGFDTDDAIISASSDIVAYIWVYAPTAIDPLTISMRDGSGVTIESKTFDPTSPANYDKTATDNLGDTWYRISLSGTNTNANAFIRVARNSGDATTASSFLFDALYMQSDTTTLPSGLSWCSSKTLYSRYDPSTSNINYINYIDTWGIPGDSDALADLEIGSNTGYSTTDEFVLYTGRLLDGKDALSNVVTYIDSTGFSTGTGSWSTGTGTIDNQYRRLASGSVTGDLTANVASDNAQAMARRVWRLFGICQSSSANSSARISVVHTVSGVEVDTIYESDYVSVNTAAQWEILDFGVLKTPPPNTVNGFNINLDIKDATAITFDFDGLFIMPASDGFITCTSSPIPSTFAIPSFTIDAENGIMFSNSGYTQHNGQMYRLANGNQTNRTNILIGRDVTNGPEIISLSNSFGMVFTITPQTRHFLGVL